MGAGLNPVLGTKWFVFHNCMFAPSGAQGTRLSTFTVEAKDCIRS